jgi:mxaJ protein
MESGSAAGRQQMDLRNLRARPRHGTGALLLARELNDEVEYAWRPQRRGFIRDTLKANRCDVVIGVPANFEMAQTTVPYYRSTYVFGYRKDSGLRITSFDDPSLRKLKIGVQIIGDDGANAPPAHALTRRGIVQNVRGYTVYGDLCLWVFV